LFPLYCIRPSHMPVGLFPIPPSPITFILHQTLTTNLWNE
jgi:hypothetical protein